MHIETLPDRPRPAPILVGRIDEFRNAVMAGWVALPSIGGEAPAGALELEALHDGQVFSRFVANVHREDVAAAIGGDGHYGFSLRLPRRLLDGNSHAIEIRSARGLGLVGDGPFSIQALEADGDSGYATCRVDFAVDPFAFLGDAVGRPWIARNIGHLDIEDLGALYPARQVNRPPFAIARFSPLQPAFEAHLRELYAAIDATQSGVTGSRIVKLRNVYAYNNRLHSITGDDDVMTVYETARQPDRPYTMQPNWTASQLRSAGYTVTRTEPLLYMGSPGFVNYGHWLVDDLPRAEASILIAERTGQRVTAIVPGAGSRLDDVKNESLRLLHPSTMSGEIVYVPIDKIIHFPEIFFVSPHTFHPTLKSPDACQHLRSSASSKMAQTGGRKRLYITRGATHGRQIANSADVALGLQSRGFELLDPERLSFSDQVAAFSHAETVIGLMGAAMTNTLFSPPGTRLLYLAPSGWIEPFYWDLAAMCDHRYGVFYGDTLSGSAEPHRADFTVPIDELFAALDVLNSVS